MQPMTLGRRAFTLVELLMVVAITGSIAMFAIPNFTKSVNKSYEKAGFNNLLSVYAAEKVYAASSGGNYAGPFADTNNVNTNLALSITDNYMTYSCTLPNATSFICKAACNSCGFTIQITNTNSNMCCAAGSCPSAPNAGTAPC